MTTIRKVAKDAGVSIATVSRVINNHASVKMDVRERVLESVNRCGYVPSVGRRATNLIGLVYAGPSSLGSPFDSALIEGMADAMDEGDLDVMILNLRRDKRPGETYTQFFLRKGVRGVILRASARERAVCRSIADEGFPSIVLGDHFDHPAVSFIYSDSGPTSCQGVEHLIALGHRRIAFASSETDDAEHADRLSGYQQALAESDIAADPKLHFRVAAQRMDGAQLMRNMMSSLRPPTAIYITDPLVAVGAIHEAHKLGIRLPQDLSILGFDDTDVRNNVHPRLTAICQDARQIGYEAFQSLAALIEEGASEPVRQVLSTWLEINATTAAPPTEALRILPDGSRVPLE